MLWWHCYRARSLNPKRSRLQWHLFDDYMDVQRNGIYFVFSVKLIRYLDHRNVGRYQPNLTVFSLSRSLAEREVFVSADFRCAEI